MAKTKQKTRKRTASELDGIYLLKLVLYLIVGSQWLHIVNHEGALRLPVPLGLIIGVAFASRERFQIDRKIEYAVLLIAMFVGFWAQIGFYMSV